MWPRRKVQLAAPPDAPGLKGVESLLKSLDIKVEVSAPDQRWNVERETNIWEFLDTPPTEIVFWPDANPGEEIIQNFIRRGIEVNDVGSFLHNMWKNEIVIVLSIQSPLLKENPLVYELLKRAGFEPSLLWPRENGQWFGVQGEGIPWIIPLEWFEGLTGKRSVGRKPTGIAPAATWVVREDNIDFYMGNDGQGYIGAIPRWAEKVKEEKACQVISQVLGMGVSWNDVRDLLGSYKYSGLRWSKNDIGEVAGETREELSPAESQHLENRRAG